MDAYVKEEVFDDVISEELDDNTIESADTQAYDKEEVFDDVISGDNIENTQDSLEAETVTEDTVVETENPAIEPLPEEDTITAEEIQGETAEPLSDIEIVEDVEEEFEAENDPEDTPIIEEAVLPAYLRHAAEYGTRENPITATDGRETFIPSLLRND